MSKICGNFEEVMLQDVVVIINNIPTNEDEQFSLFNLLFDR